MLLVSTAAEAAVKCQGNMIIYQSCGCGILQKTHLTNPSFGFWVLSLPTSVRPCVCQPLACPRDNLSPVIYCIRQVSHNTLFWNRNVHMCTFLLQNGALWDIGADALWDVGLVHSRMCATGLLDTSWDVGVVSGSTGPILTHFWPIMAYFGKGFSTFWLSN